MKGRRVGQLRGEVLRALGRNDGPGLSARALVRALHARRGTRKLLERVLNDLEAEGLVKRSGRLYRVAKRGAHVEAVFTSGASPGRGPGAAPGVVTDDRGRSWPVRNRAGARPGQRVLVSSSAGSATPEVVQVLRSARSDWVGILRRNRDGGWVTPYRDEGAWTVRVASGDLGGALDGEVVRVEPLPGRSATEVRGRIVAAYGPPGEPEADFQAIVWRHRLPVDFPDEVVAECEEIASGIDAGERERRVDLRDRLFFTIDPVTARDFDDAICVEPIDAETVRLQVAIADVSHYVVQGSALDREARYRGNSVYFPDRAIPMLPERLSSDLCSLRPDADRLAMVVELEVGQEGEVCRTRFHSGVIRSRARLTYAQAAAVMEGAEDGAPPLDAELAPALRLLARVAETLAQRRQREGAIDLDLPETELVLDGEGHLEEIRRAPRTLAHRAVEGAMLAANRAVATHLTRAGSPLVYRIHEPPARDKLEALRELLAGFDLLKLKREEILTSRHIQHALRRAEGHPESALVNRVTLRSMSQARYSTENLGHFGLGFEAYVHFTSPIRRYADLVVHRILAQAIRNAARSASLREGRLAETAAQISFRERAAVQAERDMVDLKKCAYMRGRIGEQFAGTVSGVAPHGVYVELDALFVEGLVHVSRLSGRWEFDERRHALVAERSGRRLTLGDAIEIRVESVDLLRGWINFVPVEEGDEPGRVKPAERPRGPGARRQGAPTRGRGRRSRPGGRRGRR